MVTQVMMAVVMIEVSLADSIQRTRWGSWGAWRGAFPPSLSPLLPSSLVPSPPTPILLALFAAPAPLAADAAVQQAKGYCFVDMVAVVTTDSNRVQVDRKVN